MASVLLPLDKDLPFYTFTTELDGVTFQFEFRWNDRDASHYMEIRDVNGEKLLSGKRVCIGAPILSRYVDPRLPKGELVVLDTTQTDTEPGLNDLGDRVTLTFVSDADAHNPYRFPDDE